MTDNAEFDYGRHQESLWFTGVENTDGNDGASHCHNRECHCQRTEWPAESEPPKPSGCVGVEPVHHQLPGGHAGDARTQEQPADDPGCDNTGERQQSGDNENTEVEPI
jgi:hypothetical protein